MSFRLLAITQSAHDPATRYRILGYIPHFSAAGVTIEPVEWPPEKSACDALISRAHEFDAVVLQRRLISRHHLRRLHAAARRLSFDFDDAILFRDSGSYSLKRIWRFAGIVTRCDSVTAGNSYLAQLARNRGATAGHILPTVLNPRPYQAATPRRDFDPNAPVIGWIGQQSTLPYLAAIAPALRQFARLRPNMVLRCISNIAPTIPGIHIELRPWSQTTEIAELQNLDIGLAPLPDNRWTRGKCALRLLQYLAAGIPAVASPVGAQQDIIRLGGALSAGNIDSWLAALKLLVQDPLPRNNTVRRGEEVIQRGYTYEAWWQTAVAAWCGIRL